MHCMQVQEVVSAKQINETSYEFIVRYIDSRTGKTFVLAPMGVEPNTDFDATVRKEGDAFVVNGGMEYAP